MICDTLHWQGGILEKYGDPQNSSEFEYPMPCDNALYTHSDSEGRREPEVGATARK